MSRYVHMLLPGDYHEGKYVNVLKAYINPIVKKNGGDRARCVSDGFTECEWRFEDVLAAKAATKEIRATFKRLMKDTPSLFLTDTILKPSAQVMPSDYEKTGARCIIRPDYSWDTRKPLPSIKGANGALPKRYQERPSPPLPAADYPNMRARGNNGAFWESKKQDQGVYRWVPVLENN